MCDVTLLKYSNTNTYLIEGKSGAVLFDTGWAGTFPEFCKAIGEAGKKLQDISYIMISHFHPDHMGIAQEIADHGPVIVIADVQKPYIHSADIIFERSSDKDYRPIVDKKVRVITREESRSLFTSIGLAGEIIYTPGHSDDSVSLWLDEGILFVGDLNPLYELELHEGTEIGRSWHKLLALDPKKVYYGHAKPAVLCDEEKDVNTFGSRASSLGGTSSPGETSSPGGAPALDNNSRSSSDIYKLVSEIIRLINKGYSLDKIQRKTGADSTLVEDVNRMYLTHQNVGVQGILDRIEIKNK